MATPAAELEIDEPLVHSLLVALNLSLAYLTGDDTTSMPSIGRTTLTAVLTEFG